MSHEREEYNEEMVFQSGDDVGTSICCYNCGKPFSESAQEKGVTYGCVVCTCGQRVAYLID